MLHAEVTTVAWAVGLRNLQLPGPVLPLAGMPFDHARNQMCMVALEKGFDYLFMLDSDVVPPPDAVPRLLAHKLPIVSGVYCRRSPPQGVPVMMRPTGQWLTKIPKQGLVEVDVVGAGCLLIHRSVLEAYKALAPGHHWFWWTSDMRGILPHDQCLSEDFSFCFPRGTWVMGRQVKPIEDVKVGDRVVNDMGSIRKVLGLSTRLYAGEMVRLTASYLRKVEATPGHRFLVRTTRPAGRTTMMFTKEQTSVSNGGIYLVESEVMTKKTLWLEAKDIRKGDWLYVPKQRIRNRDRIKTVNIGHYISTRLLSEFPDGTVGYTRTRKDALRLNPTVQITPGFCRLLGYYMAEGYSGKKNHSVSFAFGQTENAYIADCQKLLMELFGARSSTSASPGCTKVTVSSKLLARLMAAWCGNGAYNKHLPRFWTRLDRECLTELIKGYWRGDGSIEVKAFTMGTMSERLAREVQAALFRLDILSGIITTENQYGTVYTVRTPSILAPRMAAVVDYHDYDQTPVRKQWRYMRETKTHFLVQVESAETYLWEGRVYNLKVAGRESYTANGIAVHNCRGAREQGWKVLVDAGVRCEHLGYSKATYHKLEPLCA